MSAEPPRSTEGPRTEAVGRSRFRFRLDGAASSRSSPSGRHGGDTSMAATVDVAVGSFAVAATTPSTDRVRLGPIPLLGVAKSPSPFDSPSFLRDVVRALASSFDADGLGDLHRSRRIGDGVLAGRSLARSVPSTADSCGLLSCGSRSGKDGFALFGVGSSASSSGCCRGGGMTGGVRGLGGRPSPRLVATVVACLGGL